jgi:predicted nucleotidyltransferase
MPQETTIAPDIRQTLDAFAQQLARLDLEVVQLIVFGSQVKKQAQPWSDIDVCVVSPQFGQDRQAERLQLMKARSKATRIIEPHPYHPLDLQDQWDPLAAEITRYGIAV